MSKDRLEEARLMAEMLRVETRLPHDFPFDLVDWLIEQAEQVQELEERVFELKARLVIAHQYNDTMKMIADDYEKQNKRYREAIEVAIHNMSGDNLGVKFALSALEQALGGKE